MDSLASTNGPPVTRKKNRTWVWYFGILAVLSAAATTTMIAYNLGQQLKPDTLQAAVARWNEHGPADYDMEYTKQTGAADSLETNVVEVRGGKVVKVVRAPGLRTKDTQWQPVEERLYPHYSVPALFGFMNDFLAQDRRPGRPRVFVRAAFDEQDGHLTRYVRSVTGGTNERVEIVVVSFTKVAATNAEKPNGARHPD
jgi:uncharacterized protein DUF6174